MTTVNSKEYWDNRFSSKHWEVNSGPERTAYFAHLFLANIPQWLVHYIQDNQFSILDLGCAEGEGTNLLSSIWGAQVSGADFSESAVKLAAQRYPAIHFETQDLFFSFYHLQGRKSKCH